MPISKRKAAFLLLIFLTVVGIFLKVCINNPVTETNQMRYIYNEESIQKVDLIPEPNMEQEKIIEIMYDNGVKIKALSDVVGIDEPAILVNNQPITKREIETAIILNDHKGTPVKKTIAFFIRTKALELEAERLGIQPSEDKLNTYLSQIRAAFKSEDTVGNELIFAYLDGMNVTIEEYLTSYEQVAYRLLRRGALWESIEKTGKFKDLEEYGNELVKKAKIEILDPDIEKIFS